MTFPKSKKIKVESCLKESPSLATYQALTLQQTFTTHKPYTYFRKNWNSLLLFGPCLGLVCITATLLRFLGKTNRNYTTGQAKLVHHIDIELGYDTNKRW
jgi:hypothetical protein